jgi:hypothetical protein
VKVLLASTLGTPNKDKDQPWPEVKRLVDRAIAIDPAGGEPYFLRGMYKLALNSDPTSAEADYRKGFDQRTPDPMTGADSGVTPVDNPA